MYRAITRQIEVTVVPNFMPEQSSAEDDQYFWSYRIVITNVGKDTVQFLSLREPTGEEVLKFGLLEGLSADQFFPLVASLSATPPPVMMKIGARDILQLGTILSRFFVWAALPPMPSTTVSV